MNHDNIVCVLDKYVELCGNALKRSPIFIIVLNVFKIDNVMFI